MVEFVECTTRVETDGERLRVADLKGWIDDLPQDAVLIAVMRDIGSQRDPDPRLVGLRAKWTESR